MRYFCFSRCYWSCKIHLVDSHKNSAKGPSLVRCTHSGIHTVFTLFCWPQSKKRLFSLQAGTSSLKCMPAKRIAYFKSLLQPSSNNHVIYILKVIQCDNSRESYDKVFDGFYNLRWITRRPRSRSCLRLPSII